MISRFLKTIKDLYRVNLEKKLSMSDMQLFLIGNGRFSERMQWRRGPVRKENSTNMINLIGYVIF